MTEHKYWTSEFEYSIGNITLMRFFVTTLATIGISIYVVGDLGAAMITFDFSDFGPEATLIDFEDVPINTPMEGNAFGAVTFSTQNGDVGSFLVDDAFGVFPPHSGTQQVLKFNGSDGVLPIIAGTFNLPVVSVGAWLTTPSGLRVTVQDEMGNDLATTDLAPNPSSSDFIGFSSTEGITRILFESTGDSGIGFDDFIFTPIPEPTSLLMVSVAALLFGSYRRRVGLKNC